MDLLIEDQLLRHDDLLASATRRPAATSHATAVTTGPSAQTTPLFSARPQALTSAPGLTEPTLQASSEQLSTTLQATSVYPDHMGELPPTQVPPTTVAHTATQQPPVSASLAMAPGDIFVEGTQTVPVLPTTVRSDSLGKDVTAGQGATLPSPTLSPEEEDDIRNVIGEFILSGHGLQDSSGKILNMEIG